MDTPVVNPNHPIQMPERHHNYDEEFRREAVDLLLSSGRPLKRVAEELGVSANSLRTWRNRSLGAGSQGKGERPRQRGEAAAAADDPQGVEELRRLRQENEYLRRQRDILKKAVSILGEDPRFGMR